MESLSVSSFECGPGLEYCGGVCLRHEVHGVTRRGILIGDAIVPLNLGKLQLIAEGTLVDGRSLRVSAAGYPE